MKINIIGGGFGWELAPLNETSWGFNDFLLTRPVDVIFDMHDLPKMLAGELDTGRRAIADIQNSINEVNRSKTLMYSLQEWEGIDCIRYPIEKVIKRFRVDYFSSGVAYAIALALYQGVTNLNLYGISLGGFQEYAEQKPCVEFWLGMCMGRGVNIGLYGESEVLRTANRLRYGYNTKQMRGG